ncbi:MAG: glycosyltransferase, partial [Deinococcus sp.]|nr:glycosyltransferase [Deinococcus sp.]
YARRRYEQNNAGWAGLTQVAQKLHVIHPNVPLMRTEPKQLSKEIHLLFIGRDWARKGGVVALRVAREALRRGLPLRLTVVSTLSHDTYAEHPDAALYQADRELLALPNVTYHQRLPNPEVLRLMHEVDFTLLATAHDTYGFSVLEGMAVGTPAIVTNAAALAEVVQDGVNGYALPVQLNSLGEYAQMNATDWEVWDAFYEHSTQQILERLETLLDQRATYQEMSMSAIERIRTKHEAQQVGAHIEALYDQAAQQAL